MSSMLRALAVLVLVSACGRATPESASDATAAASVDGPSMHTPADDTRSPCAAMCERLGECGVPEFVGVPACVRDCEDDPRQRQGSCVAPRLAYERCIAAQPCPAVVAAYGPDGDAATECATERRAVIACEPEAPVPFIEFQF